MHHNQSVGKVQPVLMKSEKVHLKVNNDLVLGQISKAEINSASSVKSQKSKTGLFTCQMSRHSKL